MATAACQSSVIPALARGRRPSTSPNEQARAQGDEMSAAAIQPIAPDFYDRLGPISGMIADNSLTEILVMGTLYIYVQVRGKLLLSDARVATEDQLLARVRL